MTEHPETEGARRFIGYRPKVPTGYIDGGYGNLPNEPQYEGIEEDRCTDGPLCDDCLAYAMEDADPTETGEPK